MSPPYHHARTFNSEDFSYPPWVTLAARGMGSFISQFFEMQMKILVRLAKCLFHLEVRVGDFVRQMLAGNSSAQEGKKWNKNVDHVSGKQSIHSFAKNSHCKDQMRALTILSHKERASVFLEQIGNFLQT